MEHMVSDLLLLIKAQEPILPTASNRINVMEQVKTVVSAHRDMAQRRGIDIEIDGDESLDINGEARQIQAAVVKLLETPSPIHRLARGITVSVKPNEDGTKVLLSVLDRGLRHCTEGAKPYFRTVLLRRQPEWAFRGRYRFRALPSSSMWR